MLPRAGDRAIILVQTDSGVIRADIIIDRATIAQTGALDRGTGVLTRRDSDITIRGRGPGFSPELSLDALPS